jgi:hypothetical protein
MSRHGSIGVSFTRAHFNGWSMSALEPLAPDQRAVLSLVLQQGRSYEEIASLLGMPVDAVRARAQAGLAALARDNGLPPAVTGPVADYLLRQQPESDAEATRGLLAESEPARAWAADVVARLESVAPGGLAEIPPAAEPAVPDTAAAKPDTAAAEPAAPDTAAAKPDTAAAEPPAPDTAAAVPAEEETEPAAPDTAAAEPAEEEAAPAAAGTVPPAARSAPAAAAEPPGPRPRPVREAAAPGDDDSPPAASRLGGALLILGVLAVVAVVLFLVLRGGGDEPAGEEAAATPTPSATATPPAAQPEPAATIRLRPPGGGDASGTMSLFLQDGQLLFALEAENVPPSNPGAAYAVWFTGPGAKARRLGFTNPVGEDGRLGIQGPSDKDLAAFPRLYATYERVVVSAETDENARRPGDVILAGRLPQGR